MGGWQQMFAKQEQLLQITEKQIAAVPGTYLTPANRTTGRLVLQKNPNCPGRSSGCPAIPVARCIDGSCSRKAGAAEKTAAGTRNG